jgi:hypothetical protein
MTNLTLLEQQVVERFLSGDDQVLAVLRQQASQVTASSRKNSGVGFVTEFLVPPKVPRADHLTFKLGDVTGTAENVKHGLGFLLYITNGALAALEGYTYDELWPNEIKRLTLRYSEGQTRNMDKLRKAIQK